MESEFLRNQHMLVFYDVYDHQWPVVQQLRERFPGRAIDYFDMTDAEMEHCKRPDVLTYFCGDVCGFRALCPDIWFDFVLQASYNYNGNDRYNNGMEARAVPVDMHGLGVWLPSFFETEGSVFEKLTQAHHYQQLTESNKEGVSYRKGIYLSQVDRKADGLHFSLLRCSTNLDGPTECFAASDSVLVDAVNIFARYFFKDPAQLNHVLAQTYHNSSVDGADKKAKIKRHSDKTEDMPSNGVIAFCTFYSEDILTLTKPSPDDPLDRVYGKTSALTRLRFRLKPGVAKTDDMPEQFTLLLYPGSIFIVPLRTNRLYTHEILPSILPADRLPTRLGFVVRCSKTDAIFKVDGNTYIEGGTVKLRQASDDDAEELKGMYRRENMTDEKVEYKVVPYTLNKGDLMEPQAHKVPPSL